MIPADAHIRLAAPATNGGVRILRRGYSFTDGFDPSSASSTPASSSSPTSATRSSVHRRCSDRLGSSDALNEYIKHTRSAVFAVPPGVRSRSDWIGRGLFEAPT